MNTNETCGILKAHPTVCLIFQSLLTCCLEKCQLYTEKDGKENTGRQNKVIHIPSSGVFLLIVLLSIV